MILLRTLLFFPSITFGLVSSEVLPYALLYTLIYLKKISYYFLLCLYILGLSALYTIYKGNITIQIPYIILAYLNPLLIYILILQVGERHIEKIKKVCVAVFISFNILLVMQASGLFGLLDPVFKFFVPRSYATGLGFRGITLLSTEPARASVEYIFIYLFIRLFYLDPKKFDLYDVITGLIIFFIFKSASGALVYIVFVALFNKKIILIGLPILFVAILSVAELQNGRVIGLIIQIIDLPITEVFNLLLNTSGNRVISIVASFKYASEYLLGGGVGNWKVTSVDALRMTGINYMDLNYFQADWKNGELNFRMSGYLMNLLLDIGFLGTMFFILTIARLSYNVVGFDGLGLRVFGLFLFNISFVGSVGVPVAWIVTGLILRTIRRNIDYAR